jgi:hypothetical protein
MEWQVLLPELQLITPVVAAAAAAVQVAGLTVRAALVVELMEAQPMLEYLQPQIQAVVPVVLMESQPQDMGFVAMVVQVS